MDTGQFQDAAADLSITQQAVSSPACCWRR
ncbi:hypothetical protein [Nonomuraea basaltis]|nr:hypothetical protein [Nonomuraea basaltis]